MVLEDLNFSWFSMPGANQKYPPDEIIDKNDKNKLLELISAEQFSLKMSTRWKAEGRAIEKYEKELLEQFGSSFKEISEQRLAELESQLEEFSKHANEIQFRSLLKNVYKLDAPSLKYLFHEENEEQHKILNQSDEILKKEWKRFVEFQKFKTSLKKILENNINMPGDDDGKAQNITEKKSKKKSFRFEENGVKKDDIGTSTVPKGLSAEDNADIKLAETRSERTTRSKESQKSILIASPKGSTDQKEKRRRKNKKAEERNYGRYIDEECDICQKYEKEWENESLKRTNCLEAMTSEDAKEFHTKLVRSGGMRGLVEQFKIVLDEAPPANIALAKFIRQMAHPEAGENFNKQLVDYNCLKFLQEGLYDIEKVVETEGKKRIFDNSGDFQNKCTFCGMIW